MPRHNTNDKIQMSFRLSSQTAELLERLQSHTGWSQGQIIEFALQFYWSFAVQPTANAVQEEAPI